VTYSLSVLIDPGVADDGGFVYPGVPVEVSDRAYSVSVRRGRQDETEAFSSGSSGIQLRNLDGYFDPNGSFPLRLRQPVVVRAVKDDEVSLWAELASLWSDLDSAWSTPPIPLFAGFVEDVDLTYETSGDAEVSVRAVDGLAILSNQSLLELAVPEENGGERISRVLDADAVNYPGPVAIDPGITPMGVGLASGNVTEYLRKVEVSEQGRLFVDALGTLRFRNRRADFGTPVVFADDGSGIPYSVVERYSGARSLFNRVLGRREGGVTFAFNDARSQLEFNVRSLDLGELLTATDTFVQSIVQAVALLFARPRTRVFKLSIPMNVLDEDELEAMLSLELSSAVEVTFTPAGAPGPLSERLLVQGIEHSITVDGVWNATLYFEFAGRGEVFTLDDLVLGRLDENVLAF
jgi:hypothetical protein